MEALVDFVCAARHSGEDVNRDAPTITLNEGVWAYCPHGGLENHRWERVTPVTITEVRMGLRRAGATSR